MRIKIFWALIFLLLINLNLDVQGKPLVNIQVDGEYLEGKEGLVRITEELIKRGLKATIYVTTLFVNEYRPLIKEILSKSEFEIAIHGYKTGEILESLTYEDQKSRIKSTYIALTGCLLCENINVPHILGFRPQYFSQNKDTFSILDELGINYNSGFIEKMIYLPGHENDPFPYKVEAHSFYAVPISSIYLPELGGRIYLCDTSIKNKYKLSAEDFGTTLRKRLELSILQDIPLIVIVHDSITGLDNKWLEEFCKFLDEIKLKNLETVTTRELVERYKEGKK